MEEKQVDPYYTKRPLANQCVSWILEQIPGVTEWLWVEPSAGDGAFLEALPPGISYIAMDIAPRGEGMDRLDYLSWRSDPGETQPYLVFGNPPFGRQGSLARAFIRHSTFAQAIAFILPKSFLKPSMNRAFDSLFHCRFSVELPVNSFLLQGESYAVPCVFQIWVKSQESRLLEEKVDPIGFRYVKPPTPYHLAIRRVGVYAGHCSLATKATPSPSSHYFVVFDQEIDLSNIVLQMNKHIFPSNTTGPRSLSQSEVNAVLNELYAKIFNHALE